MKRSTPNKILLWALLAAGRLVVSGAEDPLRNAHWIWSAEGGFVSHVRREFVLEEEVKQASISITGDNGYELYCNGSFLGSDFGAESAVWQSVETFDISSVLKPGTNVVAVRATDLGGQAGVLAAITIEQRDGKKLAYTTREDWRASASSDPTGFAESGYVENESWSAAKVIGPNGCAPWGVVRTDGPRSPNWRGSIAQGSGFKVPLPDFKFPSPILIVRGKVPESSTAGSPQAVWRIGNSRAFLELDTLGPSMPGRSLAFLEYDAAKHDYTERIAYEANGGLVGSPSVSHDGKTVWFSCVPPGEKFWRIAKLTLASGSVEVVGQGPHHDFDPEPLPDGRIVFSSTRIGNREEYHGNFARSLFVMRADGMDIRAITHHIVGDMEPRLTADGNIAFVRQDNFMERAKVETHIHSVRPDGTAGQVLLGPDRGALAYSVMHAAEENGLWLRNYGFGSPAPLPDGRIAALSYRGLVISGNSVQPQMTLRPAIELVDISPLPDGRLLCTLAGQSGIGVLDPEKNEITRIYRKPPFDLHSATFAGLRNAPPLARATVAKEDEDKPGATGFLLGQSVFLTRQQNAGMSRVKAIRVIEGRPFALRSARHPYAHLGVETVELGTVPVAPDGSFYIEVPADRALSMQAVDGQGRSVVNELSWIYVRPGEQRSCVGCHSQREAAPLNTSGILALRAPPVKLLGQGKPHRWRGNNAANGGVLNLQFDRMREIGSITSREADSWLRLIEELGSRDSAQRVSTLQQLALWREKKAAREIETLLHDDIAEVRMNAALALATCGTARSLPALLRAMSRDEAIVAQAAHRAVQTLTASDQDFNAFEPRDQRTGDWLALANESQIQSTESNLVERVRRKEATEEVMNALAQIGTESAATAVRDYLRCHCEKDLRVTLAGIRALGQIGCRDSASLLAIFLRAHSKLSANPAEGDHEFGWTQGSVQIAAAAAEALGRIGTRGVEKDLVEVYAELADFWKYSFNTADHDWLMGCHASPVHFRIVEALDRVRATNTFSIAGKLLKSIPIDTDRGLLFENDAYETLTARVIARSGARAEIVRACADVLCPRSSDSPFLNAVTNSPPAVSVGPLCPESRAAQILSIVAKKEDGPLIRSAYERLTETKPSRARSWTCFYLVRALGKIGDQKAVPLLVASLLEERPESASGILPPPNVFVYEAMTPFHRAAAADALGRIGDASSAPALLKTVAHLGNALDVRHAAAQALCKLGASGTAAEIRAIAKNYPDVSVRRLLLEAEAANATQPKVALVP